jgi:hypothetical protein
MIDRRMCMRVARRRLATGLLVPAAMLAFMACERAAAPMPEGAPAAIDTATSAQAVEYSDGSLRYPFVPDPALTPGAALEVTAADICVPGYSKRVRNVPVAVKREAYANYGVRSHEPGEYEIDHLISLELGGSNSLRNLWPQSFRTHPWNAYVKDALENELHRRVCAGTIDLAKAQAAISHDWVSAYRIYVHPYPPSPRTRSRKSGSRQRRQRREPYVQPQAPIP